MGKKKNELIITGVLVLFLIFLLSKNFFSKKKVAPLVEKGAKSREVEPLEIAQPHELKNKPGFTPATAKQLDAQRARAGLDWGIDPFYHSLDKELYKSSRMILRGVSMGRDRRGYALIDDEIVTEGDLISGYEVCEVEKDRVLLKKGNESFYLLLPGE